MGPEVFSVRQNHSKITLFLSNRQAGWVSKKKFHGKVRYSREKFPKFPKFTKFTKFTPPTLFSVPASGDLYTFGERDSGKLGLEPDQLPGHRAPQLVRGVPGPVRQVACGGGHTVALAG